MFPVCVSLKERITCDKYLDADVNVQGWKGGISSNALVIYNQGPPAPWNSRDFDFWSSQSLLKAPPCGGLLVGKTTAVFPPQPVIFSFHGPFYIKQIAAISSALPWQTFCQSPAHYHGYPPPSPGAGGRGYK